MMKKVIKRVVGIDVAQKKLDVQMGNLSDNLEIQLFTHKVFKNDQSGFIRLLEVAEKNFGQITEVDFVMEATGVYHESLAHLLHEKGLKVSIVLPNKISNYMRTLTIKTVNDKTCSEALTRFGLERKLDSWSPSKKVYKSLKQLTRERDQIVDERSTIKNQLHAEKASYQPLERTLERLESRIKFLNAQEKEVKADIDALIDENKDVKKEIEIMTSIPGMGKLTVVTILGETNGFELIRNKKQLTSYAGLDVKEKSSGTSVNGKPRISKKGNRHIRKAMHLPSLSSIKYNERHKQIFVRITQKHGIKMKAVVAVQRRLLELTYVLFKTKKMYDTEYEQKNSARKDPHAIQTGS
jgi:transposase